VAATTPARVRPARLRAVGDEWWLAGVGVGGRRPSGVGGAGSDGGWPCEPPVAVDVVVSEYPLVVYSPMSGRGARLHVYRQAAYEHSDQGLKRLGCMRPLQASHKRGNEVAVSSEFLVHAFSILRYSRGFLVTFVECMGFTKASAHTKLASRQTVNDGEVAARLISEILEGRGK